MKPSHTITLAIVVICAMLLQEISCSVNLAVKKPTKQSSKTTPWDSSDKAVDGNTNANFNAGSCSRTNDKFSGWHWWQVDLQATYSVTHVKITNRADCCKNELHGFSVEVSVEEPSTLPGFPQKTNASVCMTRKDPVPSPGTFAYKCNHPVEGRYVRLIKESPMNSPILICEFEVYGKSTGSPNLALGKPATQSSFNTIYQPSGLANKAVDGNRNGDYSAGSCTHTQFVGHINDWHWWQVDLQNTFIISEVRITNRRDCCSSRLRNFTIEVSEEKPSDLPGFPQTTNATVCMIYDGVFPATRPVMLECDKPVKGRYLRIVVNIEVLTLCEVEVYGTFTKPTKSPGEERWINGSNGLWRFIYIASQGSVDVLTSSALTQLMIDCARTGNRTNLYVNPYIHIDLHTGKCRFFDYVPDRAVQPSSNWVMYKLE